MSFTRNNTSFVKAEKKGIRLRCAFLGPTGSGKTYWLLTLTQGLAAAYSTKVAVIDSEHGSAKKYGDLFTFDVSELGTFQPQLYIEKMDEAAAAGYGVLGIDSLSHAWAGQGGLLEQVDNFSKKSNSKNSYTAWREATPIHNDLVNAMLTYPGHIVVTMRSKMEYVQEKEEVDGKLKTVIKKIGLQPVQREGLEYEFDIVADINQQHELCVSKSRCKTLADRVFRPTDKDAALLVKELLVWLGDQATVETLKLPEGDEKTRLIARIVTGEKYVYPADIAIVNARNAYPKTQVLEDCDMDTLKAYFDHIQQKYNDKKAKGAKS